MFRMLQPSPCSPGDSHTGGRKPRPLFPSVWTLTWNQQLKFALTVSAHYASRLCANVLVASSFKRCYNVKNATVLSQITDKEKGLQLWYIFFIFFSLLNLLPSVRCGVRALGLGFVKYVVQRLEGVYQKCLPVIFGRNLSYLLSSSPSFSPSTPTPRKRHPLSTHTPIHMYRNLTRLSSPAFTC